MPECEGCGDVHATVNPAEWVNEQVMLCPGCWRDVVEDVQEDSDAQPD